VVLIKLDGADASALATDLMRMLIGAVEKAKQGMNRPAVFEGMAFDPATLSRPLRAVAVA
jgi:hypothetical protein